MKRLCIMLFIFSTFFVGASGDRDFEHERTIEAALAEPLKVR